MHDYWTDREVEALEGVETFDEMARIALVILGRMSALNKPIVQLCGPMSTGGFKDLAKNMQFFECALEELVSAGFLVFNQTPFQEAMLRLSKPSDPTTYCMPILETFYRAIFQSGHLKQTFFLPDWQSSTGATWERELSSKIGIQVLEYPDDLLVKARAKFDAKYQ